MASGPETERATGAGCAPAEAAHDAAAPGGDDRADRLALHLVPGLGPRLTSALLDHFGSAAAVRRAGVRELAQVAHIGGKLSEDFHRALRSVDVGAEEALAARHGVSLRFLGREDYPAALATIPDPPPVLYVRGQLEAGDEKAVALVGSRHCTGYGRRVAERLAAGLARAGYVTVSGLARGIAGQVHRATLAAGGRTLAVLAGGLSRVYPPEHAVLADEVARQGALLSEAPMAREPLAGAFPARNRIISGLCRGVVIIEAAERSGALITARHAAEQGRLVFAVPGPVDTGASGGCHVLIREGAILVRSAEDVLEELDGVPAADPAPAPAPPDLEGMPLRVWELLEEGPRAVDELAESLGEPMAALTRVLVHLEMRKVIRRLPGNRYERV